MLNKNSDKLKMKYVVSQNITHVSSKTTLVLQMLLLGF